MFKSFLDGLATKAGESLGIWLWPALFAVVVSLWVWFGSPDKLLVSRRGLLLLGAAVIVLILVAYVVGFSIAKARYARRAPVVDWVQRKVLCLLWLQPQNTIPYGQMLILTGIDRSELTLAGERLQEQGLIAFVPTGEDSLMKLLMAGREFVKDKGLDEVARELQKSLGWLID